VPPPPRVIVPLVPMTPMRHMVTPPMSVVSVVPVMSPWAVMPGWQAPNVRGARVEAYSSSHLLSWLVAGPCLRCHVATLLWSLLIRHLPGWSNHLVKTRGMNLLGFMSLCGAAQNPSNQIIFCFSFSFAYSKFSRRNEYQRTQRPFPV
jgi:hypothetical protein